MLKFNIVWLCHVLRVLAWRVERVAMLKEGRLESFQESSTMSVLVEGIEGGIDKATRRLRWIEGFREGNEVTWSGMKSHSC